MTPEQNLWSKAVALSLMTMNREQQQVTIRHLLHTDWDDESRDRQNRLLVEIVACTLLFLLTWRIFG